MVGYYVFVSVKSVIMYEAKGKVVLITGGAKGIGAEVVKTFLKEGAKHVALLDIDTESGNALQNEMIKEYGNDKVKFIKCDVSKEDDLFAAMEMIYKDNGYIDVVINNAGVINEVNAAGIRKLVEVNYLALVNGTIKAIEYMHKNKGGHGGTVINVSSIAALSQASPTFFVYFGSKSGVLHFSNCIGKEEYYAMTGVRVLTICFGGTETTILGQFRTFDDDVNESLLTFAANYHVQKAEFAGKELVEAYKKGETGSTWLINGKPAQDITETVRKAYKMLNDLIDT